MGTVAGLNRVVYCVPSGRVAVRLFLVAGLTATLLTISAFVIGWKWESERHFLKNYHTPDWAEAHIKNQMDYVLTSHEANDVIFVGDSTTTVGIQPVLYEQITGLRAYNVGLPGFVGINSSLRLLESYLENHPAPQLLVYSAHPKDYGLERENWGEIQDRFAWSYGVWSGGPPFEPDFSPIYYVREGIRITAGELRGGQSHYFGQHIRRWKDLVLSQRGFFESPGVLREDERFKPPPIERFAVSHWYARHLHALAQITLKRGIPLMIQPTPVLARHHREDTSELLQWLRVFKGEYPHVTLGKPELLFYDAREFSGDPLHMNTVGAERFTMKLAEQTALLYPMLKSSITHRACH